MSLPIAYRRVGNSLVPVPYYAAEFARTFEDGTLYRLEEVKSRSYASHGHFFAVLGDAFKNLPEKYADKFSGPEHLRKWCLIKAGFRTENVIVCTTAEIAASTAALMKELDEYAVAVINDNVLTVYRAESQSLSAMGAKRFQESKDKVFNVLAELLGVDPTTLTSNAGAAE